IGALEDLAEVTVVAPLTEQSAASHALTLHRPLRIKEVGERRYGVEGTPTDCVLVAIRSFLKEPPDLVVSGINQGPNLGEDVIYSGTVAAAMEGALLGVPAMALSLASWNPNDFRESARVAKSLTQQLLAQNLPDRFLLNVNIPPLDKVHGLRVAPLGSRVYSDSIIQKTDPRGRDYYWIGGTEPTWKDAPDTDFKAIEEGYVSMTPLLMDLTRQAHFPFIEELELQ
ncbi:MAG: 5'/3'-nucleotidase SurE, partial [Candidatus Eisenbacteria bacterium]|nr:5'/3'-nucleotidase SurE [Candidatus Eisenbacteria bacterium]